MLFSIFCRSWRYFCALSLLLSFTRFHYGEYLNIQLYICEDNNFHSGFQVFLMISLTIFMNKHACLSYVTIPIPPFPRVGDVFFHVFCIYFWKVLKRTWMGNGGVRHNNFSHHSLPNTLDTYYITISVC